ncbi:unnamed protein product [Lactuca virosa]|uniref:F-box domain-containing protein n=1 Tax=Lactuca virosa TaxID=75947 RepID=A0AAU9P554_9ASTR|nr:unnamed protein product [Lactuca virosa]
MAEFTSSESRKGNLFKEIEELTVSKPKQQWQVEGPIKNWVELPYDVMANILYRIGPIDILENAQKVCTTWCKICKDPAMWRVIHMKKTLGPFWQILPWEICRCALNRSQGQLVDISIVDVVNDELLQYVAHRSSQLKRLELAILDGCPHLQSLDLRQCMYIDLKGDMGKRCSENIKCLKLPEDSLEGCLYIQINDIDCRICEDYDDDYAAGMDFEDWTNYDY